MDDGKADGVVLHLMDRIAALERELAAEIAKERAELRVGLEQGRVAFEQEVLRQHRALKTRLSRYLLRAHPLVALKRSMPYASIDDLPLFARSNLPTNAQQTYLGGAALLQGR